MKSKKLISMIIIFIGLALVTASISYVMTKEPSKEEKKEEKKENKEVELTDKAAIEELDKYLEVLKQGSFRVSGIFDELKDSEKTYIVLHYIFNDEKNYKVVTKDTVPEKYKDDRKFDDSYIEMGAILELSFDTYSKVYNTMFGEKPEITEDSIKAAYTSPCLGVFDEEEKVMYFNSAACGEGLSTSVVYFAKNKYTVDNDYYYMYIYTGQSLTGEGDLVPGMYNTSDLTKVDVDKFEGNEDKFCVFIMKLDKNYKIVERKFAN